MLLFFFQAEDGIRDTSVTGVQTCALPISHGGGTRRRAPAAAGHHSTRRSRARARGRPSRGGRVGAATPADDARRILAALQQVILGQQAATREALVCLLARGHVLLEGVPGTAKTLLVRTLALALDVKFRSEER